MTDFIHKLDPIDGIKEKWIYQIRSISSKDYMFFQPPDLKYFDFDTQTIEYPYKVYKEKIKKKLESEQRG